MFHKKGNIFHRTRQGAVSQLEYREAIGAVLSFELGGAGRAAKTVTKWTGVTERAAKNWISGSNGPAGEHLIELMRHSDTVFDAVMTLAGRPEATTGNRVKHVRHELMVVLKNLEAIYGPPDD